MPIDTHQSETHVETSPQHISPLDRWILRNRKIITRLLCTPNGRVLQVNMRAVSETGNQTHVRVSAQGITHQLTRHIFRTAQQVELLINAAHPAA